MYTIERLATVLRLAHDPLWTLEPSAHPLALDRIVLHHQDACRPGRRSKPADHATQPLAVDRLGEIPSCAEGNAAVLLIHDCDHNDRNLGELKVLPQRC